MRNQPRPVNVRVRIGSRPVELPWPSSALAGVTNREIDAWLDRENLSGPELGALAGVLGRLSCPSDLTPLGDPNLGRVSKAAKKRLPPVILRQIKQLQAKQKKRIAERKAKKLAATATQTPAAATTAAPVSSQVPPAPPPQGVAVPEPAKTESAAVPAEPVVEPLISPEDKVLPVATTAVPAVAIPSAPQPNSPVTTAAPIPAAPAIVPDTFPAQVAQQIPQVIVQVPAATPSMSPTSLAPQPPSAPAFSPVSPTPAPILPNVPTYRPNTPLPTEYSYGFDTDSGEDGDAWDEGYEEVGAPEPVLKSAPASASVSSIGELVTGIGLLGALAWFAMRKA